VTEEGRFSRNPAQACLPVGWATVDEDWPLVSAASISVSRAVCVSGVPARSWIVARRPFPAVDVYPDIQASVVTAQAPSAPMPEVVLAQGGADDDDGKHRHKCQQPTDARFPIWHCSILTSDNPHV
jgi:hypothetical protein